MPDMTELLGGENRCSVGCTTGRCNKAKCIFEHELPVKDENAKTVEKILYQGAKEMIAKAKK